MVKKARSLLLQCKCPYSLDTTVYLKKYRFSFTFVRKVLGTVFRFITDLCRIKGSNLHKQGMKEETFHEFTGVHGATLDLSRIIAITLM